MRRRLGTAGFALAVVVFIVGLALVWFPHLFAHAGTVGTVLATVGVLGIFASGWVAYMRSMGVYRRSW